MHPSTAICTEAPGEALRRTPGARGQDQQHPNREFGAASAAGERTRGNRTAGRKHKRLLPSWRRELELEEESRRAVDGVPEQVAGEAQEGCGAGLPRQSARLPPPQGGVSGGVAQERCSGASRDFLQRRDFCDAAREAPLAGLQRPA